MAEHLWPPPVIDNDAATDHLQSHRVTSHLIIIIIIIITIIIIIIIVTIILLSYLHQLANRVVEMGGRVACIVHRFKFCKYWLSIENNAKIDNIVQKCQNMLIYKFRNLNDNCHAQVQSQI